MPDVVIERPRFFPEMRAADNIVFVVPDEVVRADALLRVRDALSAHGAAPEIVPQSDFIDELFQDAHVIACGHLATNGVLQRLYTMRYCFADTFFPGRGGYFIKTVSDPFGYGKNCLTVGVSAHEDLAAALQILETIIHERQGNLTRVHAHSFSHPVPPFPDESQLEEMIRSPLATWGEGWSASPFRGGALQRYLWYYYLTDHHVWARAVPPIFAGSIEPWEAERRASPESYHCLFNLHGLIHLWDLIEDSPLYTGEDRRGVVTMLGKLLEHLSGLFYLKPEVNPPGEPRQNHSTFVALNLAVGHDYMVKRYGIRAFESAVEAVERIFEGQAAGYKPNDDAGVGYAWHAPQETLSYQLYKDDYGYIDDGPVGELCRLAVVTTDNMRSECGYGDTAGYAGYAPEGWEGRLWPLMVSTWRTRNPRHLWTLNWLSAGKAPGLAQVLSGLYAAAYATPEGWTLDGCTPEAPVDLLGISVMDLPPSALRWVERHAPPSWAPDPDKRYFDKISLRAGFDPRDEYLLIEGLGTFCHGHEDTNAIIRLTWNNRAWLADGDYIRAAPKFHNAVAVTRDGVGVLEAPGEGVVIPPLSVLNAQYDDQKIGMLQAEVTAYNGLDWRRNVFWGKGRYIVVADELHCTAEGDYRCRRLWRLVGEVERRGRTTRVHQQGETLYIRHLDGASREVVPDAYEGGLWHGYPYADPVIRVLHETAERRLEPGDVLPYINLMTPHEDIRVDRLNDRTIKVTDGEMITVLGVGNTRLGVLEIESTLFCLTYEGGAVTLRGVERMGRPCGDGLEWEEFGGACRTLDPAADARARHLRTLMEVVGHRPSLRRSPVPSHPGGGLRLAWRREMGGGVTAVDIHGEAGLAGTADGRIVQFSVPDGTECWTQPVDAAATSLRLADLDGDGTAEGIAGTAASSLIVLDGPTGEERWRRELVNMPGRGEAVTAIAVADLEGEGTRSVLAGTAGWYVNAFTAEGAPRWARWFRYHPITAVAVADADGDGRAEVMAGNIYSTPLTVHNADGSFRWSTLEQVGAEGNATTPRRGVHLTHLRLCDVDGDGVREIVYGTADGWIYAVRPQDGEEVWHLNIVGEVTGLIPGPSSLIAANEFGALYAIDYEGRIAWHRRVAGRLRGLAPAGDALLAAAPDGLLRYDAEGGCTGSLSLGAVRGLWPCGDGVVCATEDGALCRVEGTP